MAKKETMTFPVKLKKVGFTGRVTTIPFSVPRNKLNKTQPYVYFCNAALTLTLRVDPNAQDDAEGQETFDAGDIVEETVSATCDSFTCSRDRISGTFNIDHDDNKIKHEKLSVFANLNGEIDVDRTGASKDSSSDDSEDSE